MSFNSFRFASGMTLYHVIGLFNVREHECVCVR